MPSLKGKILEMPKQHLWRINYQADDSHKYTVELNDDSWTPFNSNLHMQGIKVRVADPVPVTTVKGDAFEDTLMLLEIVKEQRMKDQKQEKEERIRQMALELKRKKEVSGRSKF
eukprot:TRINITY_DN40079_c0_g1_i1.p1 TRINITY_DN40079_c0_g1~~TRINITY_DN40079_c0_g1_i1.p1  ORF type:complete len:114 (+),score=33.63 TRINITY_DN40079_c0_g1_i1:58-399(+)